MKKEFLKNNKLILKTQQRFKSERYNFFTEVINKIVLNSNGNKRICSIGSIEAYTYETSEDLIRKKEKVKRSDIIK